MQSSAMDERSYHHHPPPAYEESTSGQAVSTVCGLTSAHWLSIMRVLIGPWLSKEQQAIGRLALHTSVRHVCRDFYLASMHLLRSHYLASYVRQVRPPYTTDPYPSTPDWTMPPHRETEILDLYIANSVRAEAEEYESSLLLTNDGREDLFAHHQPRARLEDLMIREGERRRLIYPASREKWQGVVAEDVHIDLRFRSAALRLMTPSSMRTFVEVARAKDESLETISNRIITALSRVTIARQQGSKRTYRLL